MNRLPLFLASVLLGFSASAEKPNIVFILADDLGWRDLGCYGSTFHQTPNLDRLAARGLRFTQAYAANPLCSPTRTSILTGLYPARVGITAPACHLPQVQLEKRLGKGNPNMRAVNADSLTRLKSEYFTLAEALREAGYATAHFGKWHLGHNLPDNPGDRYEPKDQGFDVDFPHTPTAAGPGGGYLAPWKFIRDPAIAGAPGEHIEDRMSAEAAKFIRAHRDRPFYVNYWAYSVHSPWNARADYIEHFKPKADPKNPQHNPLYAAMVRSLDDGVGRLLAAIEEAGIGDRTIVVFTSDNGGWAFPPRATDPEGFTGMPATSNLPLRSGKASIYEGGTREPLIVVWPGRTKPGSTTDALHQSVDFYPTLLAMCGLQPRAGLQLDGLNQVPALLGQSAPRDRVFCHFPHGSPAQAVNIPGFLPSTYVRRGDWKLIRFYADNDDGSDRLELYNLRDDIGETKNLLATQPALVAELNALIDGFLRDTEAVVPVRNPNYNPRAPAAASSEGAAPKKKAKKKS
jgi:arylsulfatase A-like enzyme